MTKVSPSGEQHLAEFPLTLISRRPEGIPDSLAAARM